MAAIHQLSLSSKLIKAGAISPVLLEELFRDVDESISYELDVAASVTDANLPGFGSGDTDITTIQTFILVTDTTIVLNWNGADTSMVVGSGQRRAVFLVYGVSTTTVPHVSNSGATTAKIQVLSGGT